LIKRISSKKNINEKGINKQRNKTVKDKNRDFFLGLVLRINLTSVFCIPIANNGMITFAAERI
jgi:hypothetical protein